MTITRIAEDRYAVVTTTLLADGTYRADHAMALRGSELRSVEAPGFIRIGGLMTVRLGAKSFAAVTALAIGESVTL